MKRNAVWLIMIFRFSLLLVSSSAAAVVVAVVTEELPVALTHTHSRTGHTTNHDQWNCYVKALPEMEYNKTDGQMESHLDSTRIRCKIMRPVTSISFKHFHIFKYKYCIFYGWLQSIHNWCAMAAE